MIDYKAWQFWFMVVSALINVVVWVGVWISNKGKAQGKDIAEVKEEIRAVDTRVTRLEENQIGQDDLAKVYERINRVSDQVSEMKGEVKGSLGNIGGSVDMILDHLLKSERR